MRKSSLLLVSMLLTNVALAEPPSADPGEAREAAIALVSKKLLQPLKKAESRRSKFSRSAAPPRERRLRIIDEVAQTDARGKAFIRFAIDAHYRGEEDEEGWQLDAMLGCVYVEQSQVFVQSGDEHLPASVMLGGDGEARSDVCRAAPAT